MPEYPVRPSHPYGQDPADESPARPPYDRDGRRAAAQDHQYEISRYDDGYEQGHRPGLETGDDSRYQPGYETNYEQGYGEPRSAQRGSPDEYALENRLDRQAQDEFPERPARGFAGRRPRREDENRRPEGEQQEGPRTRFRAIAPLTTASGKIKAIVAPGRNEPEDEYDQRPDRSRDEREDAKSLNIQGRRPSFFDMDSEAPDLGWASGDGKRVPGNGASFPSLGGSRTGPPPRQQPQSFRQPKRRKPRLPLIAAVMVVLLVVGGIAYALVGGGKDETAPVTPAAGATTPAAEPKAEETEKPATSGAAGKVGLGVYKGTSPSSVNSFGSWLGRQPTYAMDYSQRTNWEQIAAPTYMLNTWQNTDYQMVFAVAMLPTRDSTATLAAGADGDYDRHFERLAKNLVAYGQGDAILRLGWEFNVNWPWHPKASDREDFIKYWRNVVTTMRAVPGAENLKFDWNVNNGGETYDSTLYYPGNKYVDYIGVDVYDISWAENSYPYPSGCKAACRVAHQEQAWATVMDATYGLSFWSNFAQSKKKPLSLPEWGLWDRSVGDGHGGGDNPYFIEQMHKFIDDPRNNVGYQIYFDVDVGDKGDHRLDSMPKAGKEFQKLFGE
ncbi:glycosyl hydrolase [Kineosporia babensis]|uniref:GH26 domain-containing protein n=1 Tax=Kineosporia babensis TaxID=499548 RepID=A0A9X1SU64_9ACTN|nr:glycosyl hydrolase [Kineosporia babensis]MCD5312627.1 hypothetical protein [Kineosporia babensis]